MTFSMKRVRAIIVKDSKSLIRNSYILTAALLPLGLAAMLSKVSTNDYTMLIMAINMALVMTGAFVQASIMAEEKEKSTLRVLLLSPTTTFELMVGKSVLSAFITLIVVIGSILLTGIQLPDLFYSSIMILLLLVVFISLGTIIGLLSRTVMESSIVGLPVLIIFSYGSIINNMFDSELLRSIVELLPTENFTAALLSLQQDAGFAQLKWNLLNILIWAIGSVLLAVVIYGKRRFDK